MNRMTRVSRTLAAGIITAVAAWPLAGVAHAGPEEPAVPGAIDVRDGHKPFLVGHAVGVQIYSCNATAEGYGWGFVAPRATLYDDHGKAFATHFGGPTWKARDGSTVRAQRVGDPLVVDPTAIPWLLLSATSTAPGPDGGRLAETTFIQRIATVGGVAPAAAECNADTAGDEEEVPYTADYYFWKAVA